MKEIFGLSETEKQIMEILWKQDDFISTAFIVQYLYDEYGKKWKLQTATTLLVRLEEGGMVIREKRGRSNYYKPAAMKTSYEKQRAKQVIDLLYSGSLHTFLNSYFGAEKINGEEYTELKQWLENQED